MTHSCDGKCKDYPNCINKVLPYMIVNYHDNGDMTVSKCPLRQLDLRLQSISKNFPKFYAGLGFDSIEVDDDNRRAVEAAQALIANEIDSLYISGSVGTGKTLIAAITAQELIRAGVDVEFRNVPELLQDIRNSFDDGDPDKVFKLMDLAKRIRRASEAEMLILDDLGAENPSHWSTERMYMIINERYNLNKRVLITSNIALDKMSNVRVADRLRQMCRQVTCFGKSRR